MNDVEVVMVLMRVCVLAACLCCLTACGSASSGQPGSGDDPANPGGDGVMGATGGTTTGGTSATGGSAPAGGTASTGGASGVRDPGTRTLQRLNRVEYNNTVQDVFGVTLAPADDFPTDDRGFGFDNIGDVLSMSPLLFELYERAADEIVDEVMLQNVSGKAPMPASGMRANNVARH